MRVEGTMANRSLERSDASAKPLLGHKSAQSDKVETTKSQAVDRNIQTMTTPSFDSERVKAVQKAIDQGKYPLVPSKIADAIIAARYVLRT